MKSLLSRAACALVLCACAAGGAGIRAPANGRGVPGFDTRDYPGSTAMERWRAESPYRWVGYYLPAPCYTGSTWTGRRAELRAQGWGFAVIYVGEQDWAAMGNAPSARDSAVVQNPRCTRNNLNAERGEVNGAAAVAAAAADGFPDNTAIFLDVERVERISPELTAYIQAWVTTLLRDGRYVPALYAQERNAPDLYALMTAEFVRSNRSDRPRLWVARTIGFAIDRAPSESGYAVASVWQGVLNTSETWGNTTLRIDVNVADSDDPSRGR
jgi:hypothetical protein